MGVSTDGILVFGCDMGEGEDLEEDSPFGLLVKEDDDCDLPDDAPVEVVRHCSYDYPMYILAVRGTKKRASRGYLQEIDPASFVIDGEKIAAAKAFAEARGIEWKDPKWFLCSLWG